MNHSALVLIPENRFAHAAAIRLLDPSNTAVPIVTVYGPSGIGKSQMARHVARQAVLANPELRIAHLTASDLSLELAKAADAGAVIEFQSTYRRLQLLICEDIQALQRRQESQAQLLAIIDTVIAEGGRVLLTCTRPPGELKGLCPKLINRCHGGVCGEIEAPGPGTRAVLLQEFAQGRGLVLKDHWVQKLAKRINGTPRELIAAIIQLEIMATGRKATVDDQIVNDFISQLRQSAGPTLADITRKVAVAFDVTTKDLRDGGRGHAVVQPRQIAMYIAREAGRHRYTEIGHYFGGRSHSTVVHACQQVAERMREDHLLWQHVQQVCDSLRLPSVSGRRELVENP